MVRAPRIAYTLLMGSRRFLASATSIAVVASIITFAPPATATTCNPTATVVGSDRVLTFTSTSACTWEVPAGITALRALLVGGGGGGGDDNGSGGGGGGKTEIPSLSVTAGDELTITAGVGGSGGRYVDGTSDVPATAGSPSSVVASSTVTAAGGGAGQTDGFEKPGGAAGAGGSGTGGASPAGIGYVGGNGVAGFSSDITGSVVSYGGGGGGGVYINTSSPLGPATGGDGGGGAGASWTSPTLTNASAGTNGLGGGGGGGSAGTQSNGGNGGSGVVIIRYTVDPAIVTNIAINAGNSQSATAGTAVAVRPSVVVRNGFGNVVSGATVVFAVASGGGSLASSGTVTSDGSGIATAPVWTLGSSPGSNSLTATVTGAAESPLTFTATGTPANNSPSNPTSPESTTPPPAPSAEPTSNPWPESPQDATPFPPTTMLSALEAEPGGAVVMTRTGPQPQSLAPAPSGGVRVSVGGGEALIPGLGFVNGSALVPPSGNLSTVVSNLEPGRLATSFFLEASTAISVRGQRSTPAVFPALLATSFTNDQGISQLQANVPAGTPAGSYVLQINVVSQTLGPISLGIPVDVVGANSTTIVEHTFFKPRSVKLTTAGKERLAQLRQEFPAGTPSASISIVGVSLGASTRAANRSLAAKRAKVLEEQLQAIGISGQLTRSTLVTKRPGDDRVARSRSGRPLSTVSITY
jgi:outer membrane protein OmpA-like peptidoglycan-associated protein